MWWLSSHLPLAVVHDADEVACWVIALPIVVVFALALRALRHAIHDPPRPQPPQVAPVEPPAMLAPRMDVLPEVRTPPRVTFEIDNVEVVVPRPPDER